MGTKRIGLARMEALIENLKRDLSVGAMSISGMTGGITTTGDLDVGHIKSHMVRPTYTAVTTVSADGALVKNTLNFVTDTGTSAYTLPAASASTKGDYILVKYNAIIANTNVHKYGTSGEFFGVQSNVVGSTAQANGSVYALITAPNGTTNDFLNLTGATNAGPGIGSELEFWYDGDQWCVFGTLMSSGTGAAAAVTAAFANS